MGSTRGFRDASFHSFIRQFGGVVKTQGVRRIELGRVTGGAGMEAGQCLAVDGGRSAADQIIGECFLIGGQVLGERPAFGMGQPAFIAAQGFR